MLPPPKRCLSDSGPHQLLLPSLAMPDASARKRGGEQPLDRAGGSAVPSWWCQGSKCRATPRARGGVGLFRAPDCPGDNAESWLEMPLGVVTAASASRTPRELGGRPPKSRNLDSAVGLNSLAGNLMSDPDCPCELGGNPPMSAPDCPGESGKSWLETSALSATATFASARNRTGEQPCELVGIAPITCVKRPILASGVLAQHGAVGFITLAAMSTPDCPGESCKSWLQAPDLGVTATFASVRDRTGETRPCAGSSAPFASADNRTGAQPRGTVVAT